MSSGRSIGLKHLSESGRAADHRQRAPVLLVDVRPSREPLLIQRRKPPVSRIRPRDREQNWLYSYKGYLTSPSTLC